MSVGGELIGALLHTADHSPPEKRGFYYWENGDEEAKNGVVVSMKYKPERTSE